MIASSRAVMFVLAISAAVAVSAELSPTAAAQGYVAAIAFSQSTGKIGYTAREARSERLAGRGLCRYRR